MLEFSQVNQYYDQSHILRDVCLKVPQGQSLCPICVSSFFQTVAVIKPRHLFPFPPELLGGAGV